MVTAAVISDLHLSWESPQPFFRHSEDKFAAFLSFLSLEFEQVVLLGDVFECLATPERSPARALTKALDRRFLAPYLHRADFTYIPGNHDGVAAPALGLPTERWLPGEEPVLLQHGHQFDFWPAEVAAPISFIGGVLQRGGLRKAIRFLRRAEDRFHRKMGRVERVGVQAAERGAAVVVNGHTHAKAESQTGGALYLNPGCAGTDLTFVAIDTDQRKYGVHEW